MGGTIASRRIQEVNFEREQLVENPIIPLALPFGSVDPLRIRLAPRSSFAFGA